MNLPFFENFLIGFPLLVSVVLFIWGHRVLRTSLSSIFLVITGLIFLLSISPFLLGPAIFGNYTPLTVVLMMLTGSVYFLIALFYKNNHDLSAKYYALILVTLGALFGLFLKTGTLSFYLFWELSILPMVILLWRFGGSQRQKASVKFILFSFLSSFCLLIPLVSFFALPSVPFSEYFMGFLFILLFLAFIIKTPLVPFHFWQADTYAAADMPTTMIMACVLSKLGVFGIFTWIIPVFPNEMVIGLYLLVILGLISLIWGFLMALIQPTFKRVIAYLSLAHLALIFIGCISGVFEGELGAMIQIFSHGLLTLGVLMVAAIIERESGSLALSCLGGLRHQSRFLAIIFFICLLGLVGFPLTSGFVGELLVIFGLYSVHIVAALCAALGLILGAWVCLRLMHHVFMGERKSEAIWVLSGNEKWAMGLVVVMVVGLGVFPMFFYNHLMPFSELSTRDNDRGVHSCQH